MLCWNQIFEQLADAAGVREPKFVPHCQRLRRLLARGDHGLHGDKSSSVVLDNSKIKRYVPDYCATRALLPTAFGSPSPGDATPTCHAASSMLSAAGGGTW